MEHETVIIGAGLSGLALADHLARAGREFCLLEARDRTGGRVLSQGLHGPAYDLGPAWIWPHNRSMLALAQRLGLTLFEQYAEGNLVFEDPDGAIRRDLSIATMAGALRVEGGMGRITERLAAGLPPGSVRLSHRVTALEAGTAAIRIEGTTPEGPVTLAANRVVLALPPRLLATRIAFSPAMNPASFGALSDVPTWMAGHAKLVAVYDRPFWRAEGLSGDAISHRGPLMEIHDASPADLAEGALFGFLDPARAGGDPETLKTAAAAQLARLFGPGAALPLALHFKDWSLDPDTATPADRRAQTGHPTYRPIPPLGGAWKGRVSFAGTETAPTEGGFLEGALESAEACAASLAGRAVSAGP